MRVSVPLFQSALSLMNWLIIKVQIRGCLSVCTRLLVAVTADPLHCPFRLTHFGEARLGIGRPCLIFILMLAAILLFRRCLSQVRVPARFLINAQFGACHALAREFFNA